MSHIKNIAYPGSVTVAPGQIGIFSSFDADINNEDSKLMEEYLECLKGRRFKERKNPLGSLMDMNIIIRNLSKEDRDKILENKDEVYDNSDEYAPILNGVELSINDMSTGVLVGSANCSFKT